MSKKTPTTAPTTLPDNAKAIYAAAFNHLPGDNTSAAAKLAWQAVKSAYDQVEGKWVEKQVYLDDVNSPLASDNTKRNKDDQDVNYILDSGGIQPCSDCRFFIGTNRTCELVNGDIDPNAHCDLFEPILTVGGMSVQQLTFNITKASFHQESQEYRWAAVCSDTSPDSYNERMSVSLFKDFILRIENQFPAPPEVSSDFWSGGMPYLGISHYLDQDGQAVVGPTLDIYIDGEFLKAKGHFKNEQNPELAIAAYKTIRAELGAEKPPDNKIRISIAFVDWKHSHDEGDWLFERADLEHICPLCVVGIPVYEYLEGHLVHLALTRVPANTRTDMFLEEKSMTTKHEDAESIVGKEHANKMKEREEESLTSKSAVVVKSNHEAGVTKRGYYDFGGALTISEAQEFEEAAEREARMYDLWYMLEAVMDNIIYALPDDVPDKAAAMLAAIEDFKSHIDSSVLIAETAIESMRERITMATEPKAPVPQEPQAVAVVVEPHVLDPYLATLKSAFDGALANPAGGRAEMFKAIQNPIDNVGAVMRSAIESATPHEAQANQMAQMEAMLQRVIAQHPNIQASSAPEAQPSTVPVARQLQPGVPPQPVQGAAPAPVEGETNV
jgi:Mg2+ and Co2+ transporter CorA/cation transport regulator ChaB